MKPNLARQILRSNTAYSTGRWAATVVLIIMLAASALGIAVVFASDLQTEIEIAVLVGSVIHFFLIVALHEIAQANFDAADAALRKTEIDP